MFVYNVQICKDSKDYHIVLSVGRCVWRERERERERDVLPVKKFAEKWLYRS